MLEMNIFISLWIFYFYLMISMLLTLFSLFLFIFLYSIFCRFIFAIIYDYFLFSDTPLFSWWHCFIISSFIFTFLCHWILYIFYISEIFTFSSFYHIIYCCHYFFSIFFHCHFFSWDISILLFLVAVIFLLLYTDITLCFHWCLFIAYAAIHYFSLLFLDIFFLSILFLMILFLLYIWHYIFSFSFWWHFSDISLLLIFSLSISFSDISSFSSLYYALYFHWLFSLRYFDVIFYWCDISLFIYISRIFIFISLSLSLFHYFIISHFFSCLPLLHCPIQYSYWNHLPPSTHNNRTDIECSFPLHHSPHLPEETEQKAPCSLAHDVIQ